MIGFFVFGSGGGMVGVRSSGRMAIVIFFPFPGRSAARSGALQTQDRYTLLRSLRSRISDAPLRAAPHRATPHPGNHMTSVAARSHAAVDYDFRAGDEAGFVGGQK